MQHLLRQSGCISLYSCLHANQPHLFKTWSIIPGRLRQHRARSYHGTLGSGETTLPLSDPYINKSFLNSTEHESIPTSQHSGAKPGSSCSRRMPGQVFIEGQRRSCHLPIYLLEISCRPLHRIRTSSVIDPCSQIDQVNITNVVVLQDPYPQQVRSSRQHQFLPYVTACRSMDRSPCLPMHGPTRIQSVRQRLQSRTPVRHRRLSPINSTMYCGLDVKQIKE
jgi:hypothetical protein